METTSELKSAVKQVLVDMAIDDKFPLDLNALDIDKVFYLAETKLKGDKAYIRKLMLMELDEYIAYDPDNPETYLEQALQKLEQAPEKDLADDHVDMAERYEFSFTVKQLFEDITPLGAYNL